MPNLRLSKRPAAEVLSTGMSTVLASIPRTGKRGLCFIHARDAPPPLADSRGGGVWAWGRAAGGGWAGSWPLCLVR